ncbi:hypothetical protein EJ02DRAFT_198991 [Clathrospora elynae]|uniref:Uncharacterized protein n=1 Tax=Clathrospora elynae TaxID=706981 RepID=A0A6A5T1M0_9PLEO|nr:hypothetical protein EJ02DRAFT_198991 [Clathrospora elynae]
MKSAVVLALASSTFAVPLGGVIDTEFGANVEARHHPHHPHHGGGFPPMGTGPAAGLPFPMPTGFPMPPNGFPVPTGGFPRPPGGFPPFGLGYKSKSLAIDYQLAPTAVPKMDMVNVHKHKRQGASTPLPSFTFLDPSDALPQPTEEPISGLPSFPTGAPFPTGEFPTGFPESPSPTEEPAIPGLPTGGFPSFPTGAPGSPFPVPSKQPGLPFPMPTGGFPGFPTGAPELPFPTNAPPFPMPTGAFPGFPGGAPGTGFPGLPTTLETLTRGPRPTAAPGFPGQNDGELGAAPGFGQAFWDKLSELFGGGKAKGETSS